MPDILDSAQIELEECAERLDAEQVTPHKCAYIGRDVEAAIRTLQMKMSNASPGLKSRTDELAKELTEHVHHLVSDGPLNSSGMDAHEDNVQKLGRLIDEARELAREFRDDDFDLDEHRNRTTMSERYEAIGRAAYRHPDLMEGPLNELFRREPHLEPPIGRLE